jgi:hypothetical protein
MSRTTCAARTARRLLTAAAATAMTLATARADAEETAGARRAAAAREMNRPFMMAELGAGLLTLPAADVCTRDVDDCDQGESSIGIGIQNLYRFDRFGVGAGILFATTLRGDKARGDKDLDGDGELDLERDHSRRYFLVEGQFRYYALRRGTWEFWLGGTFGPVIVNDSWSVKADREPYSDAATVGPRASTVGTEGLAAGIAIGAEWTFAENWSFGSMLRYSSWFLPSEPEKSPTGDIASLSGRVDMFIFGLAIAYRLAI